VCPETGGALAGLQKLIEHDWINPDERVVIFNTGSGLKYLDVMRRAMA
jgi:threonine synthase